MLFAVSDINSFPVDSILNSIGYSATKADSCSKLRTLWFHCNKFGRYARYVPCLCDTWDVRCSCSVNFSLFFGTQLSNKFPHSLMYTYQPLLPTLVFQISDMQNLLVDCTCNFGLSLHSWTLYRKNHLFFLYIYIYIVLIFIHLHNFMILLLICSSKLKECSINFEENYSSPYCRCLRLSNVLCIPEISVSIYVKVPVVMSAWLIVCSCLKWFLYSSCNFGGSFF